MAQACALPRTSKTLLDNGARVTTGFICWQVSEMIGSFPLIIRPAFTLGGTGGGIAYNMEEFEEIVKTGLDASMTNQARRR